MKRMAICVMASLGLMAAQWAAAAPADPTLKEAKPVMEFRSETPAFPVIFEYPKDWKIKREQGTLEKYHGVRLSGPRNPADTFTTYVSIVGIPAGGKGGKFDNLAEIVKNYKEHQIAGSRVEHEKVTVVGGQAAVDMTISSVIPPILHKGLKAAKVPVRTRTLFTQKGDILYRITYSADTRLYGRHLKKFDRLLETIQFE